VGSDRILEFLRFEFFIFELHILGFLARFHEAVPFAELSDPGVHPQPSLTRPRSRSEPHE
jgi:hypothetical protein